MKNPGFWSSTECCYEVTEIIQKLCCYYFNPLHPVPVPRLPVTLVPWTTVSGVAGGDGFELPSLPFGLANTCILDGISANLSWQLSRNWSYLLQCGFCCPSGNANRSHLSSNSMYFRPRAAFKNTNGNLWTQKGGSCSIHINYLPFIEISCFYFSHRN